MACCGHVTEACREQWRVCHGVTSRVARRSCILLSSSAAMSKRPISPSLSSSPTRKRQRRDNSTPAAEDELRQPLPSTVLLLSMPKLLIQPPSHPQHELSLCLSILALRKCLKITNLSAVDECRCHTGIAEIGLIALRGGFAEKEDSLWAEDLLGDVERSISQGVRAPHCPKRA